MRWKLETAQYAQGWLGSQLQSMNEAAIAASPDPDNSVLEFHGAAKTMENIMAQWRVMDETFDDLVKENVELKRKLAYIERALSGSREA